MFCLTELNCFHFPQQRLPHAAPVTSFWLLPRSSTNVLTAECFTGCFQLAHDNQVGCKPNSKKKKLHYIAITFENRYCQMKARKFHVKTAAMPFIHPLVLQSFGASELCTFNCEVCTKQCLKSINTVSDF